MLQPARSLNTKNFAGPRNKVAFFVDILVVISGEITILRQPEDEAYRDKQLDCDAHQSWSAGLRTARAPLFNTWV